jgi:hypothetical protein
MSETGKRGSARRKGDEYQDLTALHFALKACIAGKPFEMFLDYEKAGNLDDIVLFQGSEIFAYQVKYAVNPLAVYQASDFLDPKSPVSIKKFATSWQKLRKRFPDQKITACLCSNRGLDAHLVDFVSPDGRFTPVVIEGRSRGDARKSRSNLAAASGLDAESFATFLAAFQFVLPKRTIQDLEQYIRTVLLDKELGLSDDAIFFDLKNAIKENALYSRDPITPDSIDSLLERLQSKLLIPQLFPVNQDHFVEQKNFSDKLDQALQRIDGGYLIVTGLPGSGKSTSLTAYFERLSRGKSEVFSYYCFVDVNDNSQRMRVLADSLRENLLTAFHRRYPYVLKRRFDYSEGNFLQSLETLAKHFTAQGRRFHILLDGLDHAERLQPEVRDSVISALPSQIPAGVTVVVGTQELHKWPLFLKRVIECPSSHIHMPLFSEAETEEYLCKKRKLLGLSHADIVEIHRRCEGLPLYLRYAAQILIGSESTREAVASLAPASDGDILSYYDLLWDEFDRRGMGDSRHLCAVMACLRFSVHRDELYRIQGTLTRPAFEDAFKCMSHLLKNTEDRLTVFHNSFREFVTSQISDDWSREIRGQIASFLKANKDSPRWFGHVFEYSYEAKDYRYALDEVNAEFVDRALLHFRPSGEILDAIHWAIESAFKDRNIVQLSRLGALRFRTGERLEHNLDRALLALGREQEVMSFAYAPEANRWLVEHHTALAVMSSLAEEGKRELGKQLFDVFTDEFRGVDAEARDEVRSQVVGIARCLGIYMEKLPGPLRWLSHFRLPAGILEQKDPFAPGYAPHLEAYIDALVQFGHMEKWTRLKRVKKPFPNNLVRYLLIRALARHNCLEDLGGAVSEYLAQEQPVGNVELAFYAAKGGIQPSEVTAIAGTIEVPKTESSDYISRSDPILKKYMYSFIIVGYEEDETLYEIFSSVIRSVHTLWASALHHLLKAGRCIGWSLRSDEIDWYEEALRSIAILARAEQGDDERICESIELIREALPLSIVLLTECVEKRYPERLTGWVTGLLSLRDSLLWTTHFGIGESRQDYDFELKLWESLVKSPAVRPGLIPILKSCAATYKSSTMLKGSCRSRHFLWLAALMAKCGMRIDADTWLSYGIHSSLIYGYHKDPTLQYLIDVLKLVNQRQPEMALDRCARVLSMIDWMPHLTDGRGTKWFIEEAFEAVLAVNRQAAFDLLKHFSRTTARWKMQDCLVSYILNASEGDPEYVWCLTELFSNHYSEDGRHCRQVMGTRQHIVDLVRQSYSEDMCHDFAGRFRHFVLTDISPRHWPEGLKEEFSLQSEQNDETLENGELQPKLRSDYVFEGETITKESVVSKCRLSFPAFLETIDKLKKQKGFFYEPHLIDTTLRYHIAAATASRDLLPIKEYAASQGRWQNANVIDDLAERFLEFGDKNNAIACFGMANGCVGSRFPWRDSKKRLVAVAEADIQFAKTLVLKECYDSACRTGEGYDTPLIAARGLDVLNESRMLEDVFSEFVSHCEAMFAQLPQDEDYAWLKQYEEPSEDANYLVLDFVIDQLETPEIDQGERLVRALTRLSMARPEDTLPLIVNRALDSSGRTRRRMLMVLSCLAREIPESLAAYQQAIACLLDRNDFFSRQIALRILKVVAGVLALDESVIISIDRVERAYSHAISYSTYRLPRNPSAEFMPFLMRNTLPDFSRQVITLEKILRVPLGSLTAAIEESLHAQDWSIDQERDSVKDDWYGHVHPQGWPVVWITTHFQERACEALWIILDEAAEKLKLTQDQIGQLWCVIQAVDPEYITRGVIPRPRDIPALHVADKDEWFSELGRLESMHVANAKTRVDDGDWMTVFEKRRLAQEEQYNVPYRQEISLKSCLIPRRVYGEANVLDEIGFVTERIAGPDSGAAITLAQARGILIGRGSGIMDEGSPKSIPLIAEHRNPLTFSGYWIVCSLASFIIDELGLLFTNFDLTKDGEKVAVYEVWQEGYQDECYTREKLSFGARLRLRRELLAEICNRYGRMLCTRIDEKREHFKSIHDREPDDRRDSRRYILFHS